nr:hypothetical protein Iba_chr01dCG4640 [Ipomoea batatas]
MSRGYRFHLNRTARPSVRFDMFGFGSPRMAHLRWSGSAVWSGEGGDDERASALFGSLGSLHSGNCDGGRVSALSKLFLQMVAFEMLRLIILSSV